MTNFRTHNGQIPTDPTILLALLLAVVYAAGHLSPDQTAALAAIGGLTELARTLLHAIRGR